MADPFKDFGAGLTSSAIGAFAITPSNTVDLATSIRAITLGGAGVVVYDFQGETHTTGELPIGTYSMRADRIRVTGTTATAMTGWI